MAYKTRSLDKEITRLLLAGGVGVLPTDTVYGLSGRAMDKTAVAKLYKLKNRPAGKPFIILISDESQLAQLGINRADAAAALRYWPGRLSLICTAKGSPVWLQPHDHTIAVRCPDLPALAKLISITGPLISTSVNKHKADPATTIAEAEKYFKNKLDFYVDAGKLSGKPSTIVKVISGKLVVIRPGAVTI